MRHRTPLTILRQRFNEPDRPSHHHAHAADHGARGHLEFARALSALALQWQRGPHGSRKISTKRRHGFGSGALGLCRRKLRERLANCSESPTVSAETKKGIVKRVTPKRVAEFSKVDKLPFLILVELETLGDRIRLYPFTAQKGKLADAIRYALSR